MEAAEIFRMATRAFPESWNVRDSLDEPTGRHGPYFEETPPGRIRGRGRR